MRDAIFTIWLILAAVSACAQTTVPLGSPTILRPLPAAPVPPAPSSISVEQYVYLTTQYSYLTSLLQTLIERSERQDQGISAVVTRLTELETRLSRSVEDHSTGNLAKASTFGAAAVSAVFAGVQSFRTLPKCQP